MSHSNLFLSFCFHLRNSIIVSVAWAKSLGFSFHTHGFYLQMLPLPRPTTYCPTPPLTPLSTTNHHGQSHTVHLGIVLVHFHTSWSFSATDLPAYRAITLVLCVGYLERHMCCWVILTDHCRMYVLKPTRYIVYTIHARCGHSQFLLGNKTCTTLAIWTLHA